MTPRLVFDAHAAAITFLSTIRTISSWNWWSHNHFTLFCEGIRNYLWSLRTVKSERAKSNRQSFWRRLSSHLCVNLKDSRRQFFSFSSLIFDCLKVLRSRLSYRVHASFTMFLAIEIRKTKFLEFSGTPRSNRASFVHHPIVVFSREISLAWKRNSDSMPALEMKFCQLILICTFLKWFSPWQVNFNFIESIYRIRAQRRIQKILIEFFFLVFFFQIRERRMRTPKPQCVGLKNIQMIHHDW